MTLFWHCSTEQRRIRTSRIVTIDMLVLAPVMMMLLTWDFPSWHWWCLFVDDVRFWVQKLFIRFAVLEERRVSVVVMNRLWSVCMCSLSWMFPLSRQFLDCCLMRWCAVLCLPLDAAPNWNWFLCTTPVFRRFRILRSAFCVIFLLLQLVEIGDSILDLNIVVWHFFLVLWRVRRKFIGGRIYLLE